MAEHNDIGILGEDITRTFLKKHNFLVTASNYRTRQGEIDIISEKDSKIHFVEVKSIKVRSFDSLENLRIRPEDNLTKAKWSKLLICIDSYVQHKNISKDTRWQIDLACVYINTGTRQGLVKLLQNVHME